MTKIDQFESAFEGAAKARYRYKPHQVKSVVLLTDEGRHGTEAMLESVKSYLAGLRVATDATWTEISDADYSSLDNLLEALNDAAPDLVITSRCLKEEEKNPPYSLGVYLDVLMQATDYPILVMPNGEIPHYEEILSERNEVLVVTDHLTANDRLVNWGVDFTPDKGKLVLAHVEDQRDFDRWIRVISKIPEIDTDTARETIRHQILREPKDFIANIIETLDKHEVDIEVVADVRLGQVIQHYDSMITDHEIDLVVLDGKKEGQRAMPGRAYAIVVEFQHVPLLVI